MIGRLPYNLRDKTVRLAAQGILGYTVWVTEVSRHMKELQNTFKTESLWGWNNGSAVNSLHPHGGSQRSVTPFLGDLAPGIQVADRICKQTLPCIK